MDVHIDLAWMQRCLALAARGLSRVRPNPQVGAVVVGPGGAVLGEGWHARYGAAHAEGAALTAARARHGADAIKGATLYVNLEPCSHHGKTPPCTQAILQYGIGRVVVGMADPNPRAAGGAAILRRNGVAVSFGNFESTCRRFNEAFLHGLHSRRPLVTLKIAQTLDGRIATSSGQSQWITGPDARRTVHAWRADVDGILVGSGTARMDNPSLTVRHVPGPNPHRFVLDRRGTLPAHLALFTDGGPTTAILGPASTRTNRRQPAGSKTTVLHAPVRDGHLDLRATLPMLGVQSLLVEAGPGLASALLAQDLVDRLFIFVAPKLLGGGIPAVDGLHISMLDDAVSFAEYQWEQVGADLLFRGYLRTL